MRMLPLLLSLAPAAVAQDDAPPNFEDHVAPILRENCLSCHKGSRAKNGLELRSVATILKGGSSGAAIVPGDAASSLLYKALAHEAEPFMPPDEERLGDEVVSVVQAWIDGGARATASDTGAVAAEEAAPNVVPPPLPGGPAPMPAGLATQPAWWTARGGAVTALATSPGAPLAAVAGFKEVSLYEVPGGALLGVLPFPEGQVHSLRFSPSGALLLAGGGRAADSGKAVAWDVESGRRVFEAGDEPDVVLDADVTLDHALVALGGPDRVVRAYDTTSGALVFEKTEHTDWVTAVAFSPDGVLLATGDRAGGLLVREALTGEEFHTLPALRGAVTALEWRADSQVLAATGEEGQVRLFEMENGREIKRWGAHDATLGMHFGRSGLITTAGRDGLVRAFDGNGKRQAQFGPVPAPAVCAAASHDGAYLLVGDFEGGVHVFDVAAKKETAVLAAHPPTDEQRALELARAARDELATTLAQLEEQHAGAATRVAATEARLAPVAQTALDAAQRAEAAGSRAGAAAQALAEAEDAARGFAEPLAARQGALAAAAEALARAAAERDAARAALDEAVVAETGAEELHARAREDAAIVTASRELTLARRLLDGATASAQLAAARAAEAEIERDRRRASFEGWRAKAEPLLAAARDARTAAEGARAQADALASESQKAAAVEVEARSERGAAAAELARLEEELASARARELPASERLRAAESAWARRRADLEASGGAVRELAADG
jgi:hypothetical protein